MADRTHEPFDNAVDSPDMQEHYATYRGFVRYSTLFTAHVAVILALMAYFLV